MTPRAGPLRILVVDDEPAIVRFLSASLESQGYLVSAAGNARTALDVIRKGAADLLVLDLGCSPEDRSVFPGAPDGWKNSSLSCSLFPVATTIRSMLSLKASPGVANSGVER
jgi:CheY-like chemotaxis protein